MADEKPETAEEKELRDLERQIKAQRARSADLDMRAEVRRTRAKLEEATREADEKELLTKLEAEHGELGKKIAYTRSEKGLLVVQRSAGVVWNRWKNSKMKDTDDEQFVLACRVHPDRETFESALEEQPALLVTLTHLLTKLYGFRKEEIEGK